MTNENLLKLRIDKNYFHKNRGKSKKRFFLIIILILFIVAAMLYITGFLRLAVPVNIVNISTMYPSQTFTLLHASGYVVAQRKSAVASKITGRLVFLSVEEGSKVKKGDIIARLEDADFLASIHKAKADRDVAHANLNMKEAELANATIAYNRTTELSKQGVVSQSEMDEAESRYKNASASVTSGKAAIRLKEAALKEAEVNLDYTCIRAPFDAVVLTKNADIGDIITPVGAATNARASVVTIADMDSLQVEADVSESNIERVTTGQPCEIQLDALPDKRFSGEVHMIVPTADRTKATVMVKVAFHEKDPRILPEMSAKVAFLSRQVSRDERAPLKVLPVPAVFKQKGKSTVFVVSNNRSIAREVELGRQFDSMIEILSGLRAGERVVLSPQSKIKNGTRVKIPEE
ncbi:MAG: efflux RND transporter periplasmic adaptor subunit [Candidatus Brocadiaceae bacterium]|nr:efflux RND transporter periplasmic adaptor subunit [Candidatus Brocadiaceae bacterium]